MISWSDLRRARVEIALYAGFQLLYLLFLSPAIPPTDATENVVQIQAGDLRHRAPFFAYHLLGLVIVRVLGVLGVAPATALSILSSIAAAWGVALTYRLARTFLRERDDAVLAALLTGFSGVFWYFGTIPDSYTLHTTLVLLSQVLFVRGHMLSSGCFFGLGMLIYPSSVVLTLPIYLALSIWKRRRIRHLVKFSGAAVLIFLPPVLVLWREYFYGRMGILAAADHLAFLAVFRAQGDPLRTLGRGFYYLLGSLNLILPLAALGLLAAIRRRPGLVVIALLAVPIPLYNHILQPTYMDSYLITLYPWCGLLAAWGLTVVLRESRHTWSRRLVLAGLTAGCGILAYSWWVHPLHERWSEVPLLARHFRDARPGSIQLVSDWGTCINYNYYTTGTLYGGDCTYYNKASRDTILARYREGREVFLVEPSFLDTPLKSWIRDRFGLTESEGPEGGRAGEVWLQRTLPEWTRTVVRKRGLEVYRLSRDKPDAAEPARSRSEDAG